MFLYVIYQKGNQKDKTKSRKQTTQRKRNKKEKQKQANNNNNNNKQTNNEQRKQRSNQIVTQTRKEMFYLTTHSTHFIYGYMASNIWLRTILIVRKETRCRHIGYSFRLAARVLLYASSHRQDSTYHGLCYTSRGALAGTRNSSMGPLHEGSIRRPIAPWSYISLPQTRKQSSKLPERINKTQARRFNARYLRRSLSLLFFKLTPRQCLTTIKLCCCVIHIISTFGGSGRGERVPIDPSLPIFF